MRFLIVCLLFLSFNAAAVTVTDLYQVKVPVDDQQQTSRQLGMRQAFQQVLIKISGHQNVLDNPTLAAASQNAEYYVQSFSYHQDGFDGQTYLETWFSKTLIIPLMKKAHAPIWGENRPLLLNWLMIEVPSSSSVEHPDTTALINKINQAAQVGANSGNQADLIRRGQRQLISGQTLHWQQAFERVFTDFGLPTLWPMVDLEDQNSLPLNKLWWLLSDPIYQASLRYQTDSTLAGKLYQDANGAWQYDGLLFHAGHKQSITAQGESPVATLTSATASVSYYFAEQFAIKSDPMNGRSGVLIAVKKINDFTDYSQVIAYLKSITGVRLVEVGQVNKDTLQLYLNLEGSWDKVQRIINLDDKLSMLQEKEFEWTR